MDITSYYISLLEQMRSVAMAEQEFRRQMDDDPDMRKAYAAWCKDNEYTQREGLREFGHRYMEEREERWQWLDNHDDK